MPATSPKWVETQESVYQWIIDATSGVSVPPDVFLGIVDWLDGCVLDDAEDYRQAVNGENPGEEK